MLLQHGADVMTPDGHGQTALSLASARNDTDIVNRLLLHVPAATANSINGAPLRGTRVDPFQWPKILVRQDPTTGVEQTWYRLFEVINYPDHPYFPVSARLSGGSLELYTRDGAAPATAGYRAALYALAFRRSGEEPSLMPMTFSPHREMPKEMVYPWSQFAEKADPVTGRVLYFFEGQFLQSDETNTPGWSPFNAWWFDPKAATLTHVVLPDGPWVRDAGSFQFLRGLRGFPIGPSRGYNVALLGGHIVINVLSSDGSLSESTTGTYVLNPTGKAWVKIANSDVKLGDIQIHDCVVSTTGQKQLGGRRT